MRHDARATSTCSTSTTRPTAARSRSSSVEGSGPPNDDVAARADAVRIDEEIGAFMVWGGPILTDAFADELAARQIPCIGCQIGEPDDFDAERAPYVISVGQSPDQARAHLVEWLSKQVAGRPAEFAGEDLQGQERVFGTLFLESDEDAAEQNQIDPATCWPRRASSWPRASPTSSTRPGCRSRPPAPSPASRRRA